MVDAIREQITLEKNIENLKIMLSSHPDFNLMDGFQMIDLNGRGWITALELREALGEYKIYPHEEEILLFVRRFDGDNDGRLMYSDFCEAFCPKDPLSAAALNKR